MTDALAGDDNIELRVNYHMMNLFSLQLLYIIQPKTGGRDIDDIMSEWGVQFWMVREEIEVVYASYVQVVKYHFEEISDEKIDEEFNYHLKNGKAITKIINRWRQNHK